jgi:hypothetical protein
LRLNQIGNLYSLEVDIIDKQFNLLLINNNLKKYIIKWHHHMGHLNQHALQKIIKTKMILGLASNISNVSLCEHCLVGKQHKFPLPKGKMATCVPPRCYFNDKS